MTVEIIEDCVKGNLERDISKPTLVLDAGMGNWSLFFHPLAQELKKFARVCLINRDGYLDSTLPSSSTEIFSIVHQMKKVLDDKGIYEPIIFLGHSLGGLHVRMFQQVFPEKVKGLILLDAAHPKMLEVLPEVKSNLKKQIRLVNFLRLLAKLGLLGFAKRSIPTFGLPPALHGKYYAVTTQAMYYNSYKEEMKRFEFMLTGSKSLDELGSLPLLVISSPYGLKSRIAENSEDRVWLHLQMDLSGLSTQSTFVKSKEDHFLHLTDTAFVAKTIYNFYEQFCSTHLKT